MKSLEITETPKYFYKYQPIGDKNLIEEWSLQNLLNSKAVISSRKNFNDIFDSKIYFEKPTAKELKTLRETCGKNLKSEINQWINNGKITEYGKVKLEQAERDFNELIDSYLFYCVSGTSKSNLMWSHYANSHKGFCIEFKPSFIQAEKITYKCEIPTLKLKDFIAISGTNNVPDNLVHKVWEALKVKLKEWEYEDEYRFQLSNSPSGNNLKPGEKFKIVPYKPEWVNSVIFGCRMTELHKQYIKENLPNVEFKQAKEVKNQIVVE